MKKIIIEQENIARAVVTLVNKYEKKPCRCEYQLLGENPYNLSLTSLPAAPRLEEDITGDYTAEFSFAIYLRVFPDDTSDRLDCEQFLNELAAYLEENYDQIKLAKGRKVEEVEQTQTAALINREQNGAFDYQVILKLRYNAKQ